MAVTHLENFMNGNREVFTFNRGDNLTRRIAINNSYMTIMTVTFKDNADVEVSIESNRRRPTSAFFANILWVNVSKTEAPDLKAFILDKLAEGPGQYQGIIISGSGADSAARFATAQTFIHGDLKGGPRTTITNLGIDQGWCLVDNNDGMTILGPKNKSGPSEVEFVVY